MIQFFGNELPAAIPRDTETQASLASIMCVSDERVKELVGHIYKAKEAASNEAMPGMPTFVKGFSLPKFFEVVDVDTASPNELVLVGMVIGRLYAETEQQSGKSLKRINKMMALMATNPAKAHRKMMKDLKKQLKANGK